MESQWEKVSLEVQILLLSLTSYTTLSKLLSLSEKVMAFLRVRPNGLIFKMTTKACLAHLAAIGASPHPRLALLLLYSPLILPTPFPPHPKHLGHQPHEPGFPHQVLRHPGKVSRAFLQLHCDISRTRNKYCLLVCH
jgi:hypothetical protein